MTATRSATAHPASSKPSRPPATASNRLSPISCRTSRIARCAKRRADRQLPLASGGAGEQQTCDVRAGDQQDDADGAKKDEQRLADIADDPVVKLLDRDAASTVAARVSACAMASPIAPRSCCACSSGHPGLQCVRPPGSRRRSAIREGPPGRRSAAVAPASATAATPALLPDSRRMRGMTPTMVCGMPLILRRRPIAFGSEPIDCCHDLWLMTASGSAVEASLRRV